MSKKLSNAIRAVLALMLAACTVICVFWFPRAVDHVLKYSGGSYVKHLLYAAGAVVSLPLLGVIIAAFRFPAIIERDSVFTPKTAKLIKAIAITLAVDCAAFGGVVIWVFTMGERLLSPALAFVAAIGFTVALMLYALSDYVNRAAILKEEADYTL